MTAKALMGEVIAKLNAAGFTGGFYKYNKGECSCCYGLKNVDFEINENQPGNWESMHFKISYSTDDKERATEFRKTANKLARKYFGKMADTAKDNHEAIIIHLK